jgi:hypothetical protein
MRPADSVAPRPGHERRSPEQLLAAVTRQRTATSGLDAGNPEWISNLELVVEPRLASAAVYLAASSAQMDTVELGILEGNEDGPALDTRVGFDIDTTEYKTRHVFGVKALDWRGLVKIPIATPPSTHRAAGSEELSRRTR